MANSLHDRSSKRFFCGIHWAWREKSSPPTRKLFDQLLKPIGLTNGSWATLMELALKDGPPPGARLPQLGPLLFQGGKRQRLFRLFMGDRVRRPSLDRSA